VTAFVISVLLQYAAAPWLPGRSIVVFLAAVILTTVFAGLGPAMLAASLSFVVLWYLFVQPYYSFELDVEGALALARFVFACGIVIFLTHWLRVTINWLEAERAKSEAAERRAKTDLLDMTRLNQLDSLLVREDVELNSCLDAVLDAAMAIARADKGTMQLLASNSGLLTITAHRGFEDAFLNFFACVRGGEASVRGQPMRSADRVIVEDVMHCEIFAEQASQQALIDAGVRGMVSVPLEGGKNNLLGMISVHFSNPHRPTERELRFLDLLARQTANFLDRKRAEQTEKMLIRELQHRSNNLLTIVQAVAYQTLSGDGPLAQASKTFEARLRALARSNEQLIESNQIGVELRDLLRLELEPYGDRVTTEGARVMIGAQRAHNVALALHELATNAAKYGALSNRSGKIEVHWTVAVEGKGDVLKIKWQEIGGPNVVGPTRHGFGTKLLQTISLSVQFDYFSTGLICAIDMLLDSPE